MKKKSLLLIFVKNPEKGSVKTRLAKTAGDEKAYQVYKKLLKHTISVAEKLSAADKQVWYSSYVDRRDDIDNHRFAKYRQPGGHLGERMKHAFGEAFGSGYDRVVIIGSDCPGITPSIIEKAFAMLESRDVVLGPSDDGGYYLFGMNRFYPWLFENIGWSTDRVLPATLEKIERRDLQSGFLPVLNDIDTEEDLETSGFDR